MGGGLDAARVPDRRAAYASNKIESPSLAGGIVPRHIDSRASPRDDEVLAGAWPVGVGFPSTLPAASPRS